MASRKLAQQSTICEVFETTFRKTSHSDRSEMWITKLGQIMKKDQIKSYGPTCSNISTMVFKTTFRRSKIETKPRIITTGRVKTKLWEEPKKDLIQDPKSDGPMLDLWAWVLVRLFGQLSLRELAVVYRLDQMIIFHQSLLNFWCYKHNNGQKIYIHPVSQLIFLDSFRLSEMNQTFPANFSESQWS